MYRDVSPLPLDSPRWAMLRSMTGKSGHLPALLARLARTRPIRLTDHDGPWSRIFDAIYHQGSVTVATYACVPHLVAIAEQVEGPDREELCLGLGWIADAISRDGRRVDEDLELASRSAFRRGADVTIQLLTDGPVRDTAHSLAFGALAMLGHAVGRLADAELAADAAPEVECECTACGAGYRVVLRPDGIAACRLEGWRTERPPERADATQPPYRVPETMSRASDASPAWAALAGRLESHRASLRGVPDADACVRVAAAACRAGVDSDTDREVVFAVVAAIAMAHGAVDHGRQLMRLAGEVRCPECDEIAPLASQMLDLLE